MGGKPSFPTDPANLMLQRGIQPASSFLSEKVLEELKQAQIAVLLPNTPEYLKNCIPWNYDLIRCPSAFLLPKTAEEVSKIMKIVVENGLDLAVAAGKHSHCSLAHNAVVVDLQNLNSIDIDEKSLEGRFGAGLKLGALDAALSQHSLAVPVGTNPDTGIAGLIMGGGFGYLCRQYGLSVDNVISAQVVLVNGDIVTASPANDYADLLWGIKGGGGNFGIVTQFHMKLYKIGPVLLGANVYLTRKPILSFPGAFATLQQWRDYSKSAPNTVFTQVALVCNGPIACGWAYSGSDVAEGRKLHEPFSKISASPIKTLKQVPYSNHKDSLQNSAEEHQRPGNWYEGGLILNNASDEALEILLKFSAKPLAPNNLCTIVVQQLGGKMSEIGPTDTAFVHRDAQFWILLLGRWDAQSSLEMYHLEKEKVRQWVKALAEAMGPFCAKGKYNTLGETEKVDKANEVNTDISEVFYGQNVIRLKQLKLKYDPNNVLKRNKNIQPHANYVANDNKESEKVRESEPETKEHVEVVQVASVENAVTPQNSQASEAEVISKETVVSNESGVEAADSAATPLEVSA